MCRRADSKGTYAIIKAYIIRTTGRLIPGHLPAVVYLYTIDSMIKSVVRKISNTCTIIKINISLASFWIPLYPGHITVFIYLWALGKVVISGVRKVGDRICSRSRTTHQYSNREQGYQKDQVNCFLVQHHKFPFLIIIKMVEQWPLDVLFHHSHQSRKHPVTLEPSSLQQSSLPAQV